jgi:hypothetical protein
MYAGDGARRDSDGFYWITGRVDDIINVCCVTVSQNGVATLFRCLLYQFIPAVMVKGGNDSSESLLICAPTLHHPSPAKLQVPGGRALCPSFLLSNVLCCPALICTALHWAALRCTGQRAPDQHVRGGVGAGRASCVRGGGGGRLRAPSQGMACSSGMEWRRVG